MRFLLSSPFIVLLMKWNTTLFLLFLFSAALAQQNNIRITWKPLVNQPLFVHHYYASGGKLVLVDSVLLDGQSEGVLQSEKIPGDGIYIVRSPATRQSFPFIIDRNKAFSINADTANPASIQFVTSPENTYYAAYQAYLQEKNSQIQTAVAILQKKGGDSIQLVSIINALQDSITANRKRILKQYPASFLAAMLKAMLDPEIPGNDPRAKTDSLFAYRYIKYHYWDHLPFYEDRMLRTPYLEARLDRYFTSLVRPVADSVNKEMGWMLGYAAANEKMQQYLLNYFITRYGTQLQPWHDNVFLFLYENYFNGKTYPWLQPIIAKNIAERATRIMATHGGQPAPELTGPDLTGKQVHLSAIDAPYTLLVFWDATCGHCRLSLPKLNEHYQQKWKQKGVQIFAMSSESEGTAETWKTFVTEKKLSDWTHVYYSRVDEKRRADAGLPGYGRLYDVQRFPTFYLLDKDKNIIARKITEQQVDAILQLRTEK